MRLQRVARGHRLPQKLMFGLIRVMTGHPAQDILRTIFYRPAFFGTPFAACMQEVMRGPSEWSVGEREIFAAFVSHTNKCAF
jgi:hypothetical protein